MIPLISEVIRRDHVAVNRWTIAAHHLLDHSQDILWVQQQLRNGETDATICFTLQAWRTRNGSNATIAKLQEILREDRQIRLAGNTLQYFLT